MHTAELQIGTEYSKTDIERIFATNFGARIKGITQRRSVDGEPYILLFATARGAEVYGDTVDGDVFYYKGEGIEGDQKLTTANNALVNANSTGVRIYGFRQLVLNGGYVYLGLVTVLDAAYIRSGERMVYEFKMQQQLVPNETVESEAISAIETRSLLPKPTLTSNIELKLTPAYIRTREAAFRKRIKEIYEDTCAVCGAKRYSIAGYPEVQAAHIYPKEKNGSDDLRNGFALCRLHHWAFDSGLIAVTNDLKVLVAGKIVGDQQYVEIARYAGCVVRKPVDSRYVPDSIFLTEHRRIHGFPN